MESRREFRTHIRVQFDADGEEPHHEKYTLLHNSIFVSLPPCTPGQIGTHREHMSRLRTVEISVEMLKKNAQSISKEETLIINATGEGTKVDCESVVCRGRKECNCAKDWRTLYGLYSAGREPPWIGYGHCYLGLVNRV
jgi:hypothetical protein